MIDLKNRKLFAGAALGAIVLAGAGGYYARASAEGGAVNAPGYSTPLAGAPMSFADIVQRVAPAVVSIDVEGKVGPSRTAYSGGQGGWPFTFRFGSPGQGDGDSDGNGDGDQANPFQFFGFPQMQQQAPQKMRASGSGFFISADGYLLTNNHVVEGADKITVHIKDGRDLKARVIGVNTAIYSPSGGSVGIGFDIPADVAAQVSRQLIEHGKIERGYIGATVQPVTAEISESLGLKDHKGALVADLTPGGPAEQAGVQPGDVVLAINGKPVDSADDLTRQVGSVHPGETARLEVLRNGRTLQLAIRSGLRPSEAVLASDPDRPYGGAPDASAEAARILGMRLEANPHGGVTVGAVASDSDAADKGLSRGDTILQANGRRTATPGDVASAVAAARKEGRHEVLLMVAHNGRRLFLPLKIDNAEG